MKGHTTGTVAILRDITARKRAEMQIAQSQRLATMGQLLASVAHELNNPLAIVLGRAEMLADSLRGDPNAVQARQILEAAERCARTVGSFLALARQRPPVRERVDLNTIVSDTLHIFAYDLRVNDIAVLLDPASELPLLWANGSRLQQVLINLVTNASQAMRGEPPPRRLTERGQG